MKIREEVVMEGKRRLRRLTTPADEGVYVRSLAEVVLESIPQTPSDDLESFELYAHQVHKKLFANRKEFLARFVKGYKVMLEELSK